MIPITAATALKMINRFPLLRFLPWYLTAGLLRYVYTVQVSNLEFYRTMR